MSFRHRQSGGRILLLAICGAALIGCAYELVQNGTVNGDKAATIQQQVQQIRQLAFKKTVPVVVETRDEAERDMIADLEHDYTDEQLRIDGQAGVLIGLYPPDIDLKGATIGLLKSQIAGFYDAHRKQMVLVGGSADFGFWNNAAEFIMQRDMIGEMLLAHELTHALQDQHFGLEKSLDEVKNNDDRSLALKSVAEGDATLAGFGVVMGKMDVGTVDTVIARLADLPQTFAAQTAGTPEGISAPMVFQYSAGVKFVGEAFRRGGWKAVDALYAAPPLSSREVLNPASYFDYPVSPMEVKIAGHERVMGGWKQVEDNTIGQLLLEVILKRGLGERASQLKTAERWRGDQMIVLRKENALTVLWFVAMGDDRSAQEFAVVYTSILDRLLGQKTPHRVDYKGSSVLAVVGHGAGQFEHLAPSVWEATQVRATPAHQPLRLRAQSAPVSAMAFAR